MKYRVADFYGEFHCVGGICEDSCCENWEIDLDEASMKRYLKEKGELGKRFKENTRTKERKFILNGTRCPFLNEDNLCDIFIKLGEEFLCETCTNFPRHIEEFDDLKEISLTMSCPEASRIMLSKTKKMSFVCNEGTDEEYGLKHIEPARSFAFWKRGHVNKLDKVLYDVLYDVREFLFEILQNRTIPIARRAATVLLLGYDLQPFIDNRNYDGIREKLNSYRQGENREWLEQQFSEHMQKVAEKEEWMRQILNMYEGLETIKEEWSVLLSDGMKVMHGSENLRSRLLATGLLTDEVSENTDSFLRDYSISYQEFLHYYGKKEYEYEHILVYYIFNYFLGASYDHDIFTKVKFAIVSFLVILELDVALWLKQKKEFLFEDQVLVAHAYSKEVEHSYNNYESLQLVLSAHPIMDMEHILLSLLS